MASLSVYFAYLVVFHNSTILPLGGCIRFSCPGPMSFPMEIPDGRTTNTWDRREKLIRTERTGAVVTPGQPSPAPIFSSLSLID